MIKLVKIKLEIEAIVAIEVKTKNIDSNGLEQIQNSIKYILSDSIGTIEQDPITYTLFDPVFDLYPNGWNDNSIPYSYNLNINKTIKQIINPN